MRLLSALAQTVRFLRPIKTVKASGVEGRNRAVTNPVRAAAKGAFGAMMQMNKIDIATIEAPRRG